MKEANFNTEIVNSIKDAGHWAYKIPDMPRVPGLLRFIPDKPCDIIASVGGRTVAIESKQFKKWQALGMRHLEDSQIKNLDEIVKDGGKGFIFLNIRIKGDKELGIKRENKCLIFEWNEFKLLNIVGSIKKLDLLHWAYIEGKLKRFDLSEFLDECKR